MNKEIVLNAEQSIAVGTETSSKRFMWQLINATLFRIFPTGMRNLLLQLFGARMARTAVINRTARIESPWNFEMGELSRLGAHSFVLCQNRIIIGEKCRIGEKVSLLAGSQPAKEGNINQIIIGNGCWISSGSSVLRGVRLGQYTMVGENSMVDLNTEPFTTVAGTPARVIEKAMIR